MGMKVKIMAGTNTEGLNACLHLITLFMKYISSEMSMQFNRDIIYGKSQSW